MSIYLGGTKIGQMYLGSTEIGEAYIGSTKVFDKGGAPVPDYIDLSYVIMGANYLGTGIGFSNGMSYKVDFRYASVPTSEQNLITTSSSVSTIIMRCRAYISSGVCKFGVMFKRKTSSGTSNTTKDLLNPLNTNRHNVMCGTIYENDKWVPVFYLDGSLVSNSWEANTSSSSPEIFISAAGGVNKEIYSLIIYDSTGNELLHYKPSKRTSDNAVGFYDTVADAFVTVAGLVAGPEL